MFDNFESLFCRVGLGNKKRIDVNADGLGVDGVHRVFHVDICAHAASFLGLCDGGHCESGFSGGFGTVDFDDATAWQSADAEGDIE